MLSATFSQQSYNAMSRVKLMTQNDEDLQELKNISLLLTLEQIIWDLIMNTEVISGTDQV